MIQSRLRSWWFVSCLALACAALVATEASAAAVAKVIPSASLRFAAATGETPSMQRHVLPLMGRLGCNGRACHGSFQGQGGFRLSLFGYDFDADLEALTGGEAPRVDAKNVAESLILYKPTHEDEHGGGERMKEGSWEYNLLRRWIESGAKGVKPTDAEFVRLEVTPREIVFAQMGEQAALKVLAHWSDGSVEDVTQLCRFQTNDESVAAIDLAGTVRSVGKGDTHVVAFYDNGVVPVPVLLPVSDQIGPKYPLLASETRVDELIQNKLRKLGIIPSEVAGDMEYLRRVSLDITGTLPEPDEILAFAADKSPDKRRKKVDELLARPSYAAWWATKLCDLTGNRERDAGETQFRREMTEQWYRWIHERVERNVPYDQIVSGIVMAVSREPGESYEAYCAEMSSYCWKKDAADFSQRETMPYFWMKRTARTANEKALAFSYSFLGVRLQCAECHKHPFDQWSQQDFQQFTAFFEPIRYGRKPEDRETYDALVAKLIGDVEKVDNRLRNEMADKVRAGGVMPFQEMFLAKPTTNRARSKDKKQVVGSRVITPRVLGGEEVMLADYDDPREPIIEWLTHPENPYFARSFVNRVWAHYFGVGIVEPADDMNLANAPSNRELLDYLADEFVRQKFDMRWLHREIANSTAYQRTWKPNATNVSDSRNFSRAQPRRLPAEAVYDAVVAATAGSSELEERRADPVLRCSIGLAPGYTALTGGVAPGPQYALAVFGKPMRETTCDCERSSEATLLQTVYLRNDSELLTMIDRRTGWLAEVAPAAPQKAPAAPAKRSKNGGKMTASLKSDILESLVSMEAQLERAKAKGDKALVASLEKRIKTARSKAGVPANMSATQFAAKRLPPSTATVSSMIRDAYLRTLSRVPNATEVSAARRHIEASKTPKDGLRDLLWALVNTKEFVVNH